MKYSREGFVFISFSLFSLAGKDLGTTGKDPYLFTTRQSRGKNAGTLASPGRIVS
jgi:hypothetical protein